MIPFFKKNSFFIVLLLIFSLSACKKEEEEPEFDHSSSVISFSPTEASWYLRRYPDSILVTISGGTPPYVIKARPDFSCSAIIQNNQLVLYPKNESNVSHMGKDFIVVEDNSGNVNSFNISVNSLYHYYDSLVVSISIAGDTNLTLDDQDFVNKTVNWDEFFNDVYISMGQASYLTGPSYFKFLIYNVPDTGVYTFKNDYDLEITNSGNTFVPYNQRFSFGLLSNNQTFRVKKLKSKEMIIEANVDVQDTRNNFQGIHNAQIKIHARRK
ncbi:MAG: hypothetical protein DWP98_12540 [Bacteroidetes bacterium]|nr:MAG: hypothetical protein DWP98_12540 [Bacteroidota bacterium]MBL1145174.1 hypothetical protein [Bacteroidota bacterium]NOG57970.1 hypothetical protein [Bacteroidota bacterium]